MSIRDALTIAWTKVKSRKVRSIMSALISGIMLIFMLSFSMAYTGNKNALENVDGISGRFLLHDRGDFGLSFEPPEFDEDGNIVNPQEEVNEFSPDEIKQEYADYNVTNVYEDRYLFQGYSDALQLDGKAIAGQSDPYSFESVGFAARSNALLENRLDEGENFEIGADGSIPILLSVRAMTTIEDVDYRSLKAEERVNKMGALADDYRGKTLVLSDKNNDKEVKLRVVGFAPSDTLFGLGGGASFFPLDSIGDQQKEQLGNLFGSLFDEGPLFGGPFGFEESHNDAETLDGIEWFNSNGRSTAILEFDKVEDLKKLFSEKSCERASGFINFECRDLSIIGNASLEFEEVITTFWGFFRWVLLFFAAVTASFLFVTMSKIISDSRKETGVFRAMGAQRLDIAKIYVIYITIVSTLAYILAFLMSLGITAWMTRSQGPGLSATLTDIIGNFDKAFEVSFVGLDPVQLGVIWFAAVIVGVIGGAIPIARNVLQDPIKAMRSE